MLCLPVVFTLKSKSNPMITITVVSMLFNILLTGAIYFIIHGDKYTDKDFIIMNQQVRINQLTQMLDGDTNQ